MYIILYIGAALSVCAGIVIISLVVEAGSNKIEGINFPTDPLSLAFGTFFLALALGSVATFLKNRRNSD